MGYENKMQKTFKSKKEKNTGKQTYSAKESNASKVDYQANERYQANFSRDAKQNKGGTAPESFNGNTNASNRAHWNKLWVPPSKGEDIQLMSGFGRSSLDFNQQLALLGEVNTLNRDLLFPDLSLPFDNFMDSGLSPFGLADPYAKNANLLLNRSQGYPSLLPHTSLQLDQQLEEINALLQFKLNKLNQQKQQNFENLANLQLLSTLNEQMIPQKANPHHQDYGFHQSSDLKFANEASLRPREVVHNGTVYYEPAYDFRQGTHNQVKSHSPPSHTRATKYESPEAVRTNGYGNQLLIPNTMKPLSPDRLINSKKSPGSLSPKAVSDFPGGNSFAHNNLVGSIWTTSEHPRNAHPSPSYSNGHRLGYESCSLPSQDELDFHLATIQRV